MILTVEVGRAKPFRRSLLNNGGENPLQKSKWSVNKCTAVSLYIYMNTSHPSPTGNFTHCSRRRMMFGKKGVVATLALLSAFVNGADDDIVVRLCSCYCTSLTQCFHQNKVT